MNRLENIEKMKKHIQQLKNNGEDEAVFNYVKNNIPRHTMYSYMLECNKNNMNNPAIRLSSYRLTYQQFDYEISRYAKGLLAMGIKKGDRVALLLPNLPTSTIIIYALNKIGAISFNIDPSSKPDRIKYFLEKVKISSIICFDKIYGDTIKPNLDFIRGELNIDKILIPTLGDSLNLFERLIVNLKDKNKIDISTVETSHGKIELISIPELLKNSKYTISYTNPYTEGEIASICHSSGTTGLPKILPSTNENCNFISFQHQLLEDDANWNKIKTMLHILPGFAKFGFTDNMHLGHVFGLELIEVPIFSHEFIIDTMLKCKPNCVIAFPSFCVRLVEDPKYANIDLSFLEEFIYGGGQLTIEQVNKINRFLITHGAHCLLRTGYGLSELDGTCILEDPFTSTKGSCGTDLIGGKGIIIDPNTLKEVPNGEIGELWFTKGSFPVTEFEGHPILNISTYNGEEYLRTGDNFIKNSNGEYFFQGRISNMICRFDGYKVFPSALEQTITSSKYIEDALVTSYYEEEKFGDMPLAYIVLSENSLNISYDIIIEDIIEKIINNSKLSFRDIPRKIKIVNEIPLTKAYKKDYITAKNNGLSGNEITIITNETNIGLKSYKIIYPNNLQKIKRNSLHL